MDGVVSTAEGVTWRRGGGQRRIHCGSAEGLGGFTLDVHHVYGPVARPRLRTTPSATCHAGVPTSESSEARVSRP
jgi:hypothetical protein